jgi:succinyl-CoA synthetase beta subunit
MKYMEYQARETFDACGIPVMNAVVIDDIAQIDEKVKNLSFPLVIKAQVQAGGRGKAGGILFANTAAELKAASQKLLHSDLKGHRVNQLMIVEKASGDQECYLSVVLDRMTKRPMIIFSAKGGVDIEETAVSNPNAIIRIPVDIAIGIRRYMARYIVDQAALHDELVDVIFDLIVKMYRILLEKDATLVEINPLLVCGRDRLIALDGKVDIDDSALYRQSQSLRYRDALQEDPLVLEARRFRFLYIPIETSGTIGVISNGSGMLMSSIDLISKHGMTVGAALDLGGGATAERIKEAIRILFSNQTISYLYINIFGGITRCDEVAEGVKAAMGECHAEKNVVVRLEGTNQEKGMEILRSTGSRVVSVDGLLSGVEMLKRGGQRHEHID